MPLEVATSIEQLDSSYPLGGDPTNRGDDHLRLIKSVLKTTFPGAAGQGFATPITATEAEINRLAGVTSNIQTQIDAIAGAVKNSLHPIGSIYINAVNNTNPATLLGFGTWVAFGSGRVPVGFDGADASFNAAEKIGGNKDATLPAHNHTGGTDANGGHDHGLPLINANGVYSNNFGNGPNVSGISLRTDVNGNHAHSFTTNTTGSSATNANLPPYITVYMWKRTA